MPYPASPPLFCCDTNSNIAVGETNAAPTCVIPVPNLDQLNMRLGICTGQTIPLLDMATSYAGAVNVFLDSVCCVLRVL